MRRRVLPPLVEQARNAASSLADVLTDPLRVVGLIGGPTGITSSFILTLAAAVAAFDGGVSFPEIGAAYLVAAALGSAAPTPGGLGAVEGALVAALTGYGMPAGNAVSAVLTFRLVTYWLPMLPGWFMFQQMQRREEPSGCRRSAAAQQGVGDEAAQEGDLVAAARPSTRWRAARS